MENSTRIIAAVDRASDDLETVMRAIEIVSQFPGDNPLEAFNTDILQEAVIQLEQIKEKILAAENSGR